MVECQLGVLLLHQRRHRFPPKPGRGEDVGLVDRVYGERRVCREGALRRDTGDAFNLRNGVGRGVGRDSVFPGFDAVAKVLPPGNQRRPCFGQ